MHIIFKEYDIIITIEDHSIKGGFGTAILEFSANNNYKNNIKTLGIPDRFIEHGSVAELQRFIGLDVESLTSFISSLIK